MSTLLMKSGSLFGKQFVNLRGTGWQANIRSYAWSPPTDVYETETNLIVRVEVAGMRQSDFSVSLNQEYLSISGARSELPDRRAYRQMEIRFGEFSTAVELPPGLDIENTEADYEDGFLMIILPKKNPTAVSIKS